MHALTPEKRRELLDHYMAYEPTMEVNGFTHHVHVMELPEYMIFVALNGRMQWIEGAAIVPKPAYEQANSGLAMAWLVMTAYDDLECSVKNGNVRLSLKDMASVGL
jgi:hypothetical protein